MESSQKGLSKIKQPGAPTKYSSKVVKAICEAIELGCSDKEAAAVAGIHATTLCVWKKQHPELLTRIESAEAKGVKKRLDTISQAAENNPKWAAWILEHRWPERWARANRGSVELHVGQGANIAVVDHELCSRINESWGRFTSEMPVQNRALNA